MAFLSGRFVKQEQKQRRAEIGVWVQAPDTLLQWLRYHAGKDFEIVYAKSCNIVHFGRKLVRKAVHNAFFKTLTVETPRSYAFGQLLNNGNGVPTRSPRNDPSCSPSSFLAYGPPRTFIGVEMWVEFQCLTTKIRMLTY